MKETKQQAHREKETPDVRKFTHAIFFSKPRADDQVGALRVRCTARPSSVGGARRRANAFSLCGLSHCDDSPPLLRGTPRHSVFTACRIQARASSRGARYGYVVCTQRVGHNNCCRLGSALWLLRARRTHSRGAYLFFASMSAIDHDGACTTAVNLRHPFVVGIVRFKRCTQCFVLLVGGVVFDFHIDQAAHR